MLEAQIRIEQPPTGQPDQRTTIEEANERGGSVPKDFGVWIQEEHVPRERRANDDVVGRAEAAVLAQEG